MLRPKETIDTFCSEIVAMRKFQGLLLEQKADPTADARMSGERRQADA
jgi:hypothetical protein